MQLNGLLSALLGPNFHRLPELWAWYVCPGFDSHGWRPHRDKSRLALLPDGSPQTLTLWLPLTDATPQTGCIHVVPADMDPTYNTAEEDTHRFPLQAIRAVPAAAGSVLGWNAALLHWGSFPARASSAPRVSVSVEFQRGDVPPFDEPLMRSHELPVFSSRLTLIAKQILQYQHMDRPDEATLSLAREILVRRPLPPR